MQLLSIIVPVFNEEKTIRSVIEQLLVLDLTSYGFTKEIIVVNDGSTDSTQQILGTIKGVTVLHSSPNRGKGFALRLGVQHTRGDFVLVQDADLEYSPVMIPKLLDSAVKNGASVVYGSRFFGHHSGASLRLHYFGNLFLSAVTAFLYFHKITDMETGYKLIKKSIWDQLNLRSNRFDIEPEITAKLLKKRFRIFEVPIDYTARNFSEGKKLTWKDGVTAFWVLLKYRFMD